MTTTTTIESVELTAEDKQVLRAQARGCWQLGAVNELIYATERTPFYPDGFAMNPMYALRGNARSYMGRYQSSFYSLIQRIRDAGFVVDVRLGPKGGLWSASYRVRTAS